LALAGHRKMRNFTTPFLKKIRKLKLADACLKIKKPKSIGGGLEKTKNKIQPSPPPNRR